jgi:hypothetical protein
MRWRPIHWINSAILLAACAGSEPGPTGPVPRLGLGNDPDRIRVRDQRREPFTTAAFGCISEPLVVTGTVNYILHAQDNPADNVHSRLHTNLQGVSGIGSLTGTRYQFILVHNVTYNYVAFLDPPRFETNQVARFRLIGDRTNNNLWVNTSFHVTVTPDGKISSTRFEVEARCAEDG